jgi:hypothetical protein
MKFLRIAAFVICSLLAFGSVEAQHRSTSRPNYSGGKHSKSHGGHYQGQQNSHHKVGIIRTQERAINMGVTNLKGPVG